MMTQTSLNLVTRELVPEDQRTVITEKLFGLHFPMQFEPVVYGITYYVGAKVVLFRNNHELPPDIDVSALSRILLKAPEILWIF